jgi:rhodanese-related sulfurtransferase
MSAGKKGYKEMVDEALTHIVTLSVDETRKLHGDANVVFVDLRDIRELEREGLMPGAFHAPRGMLEFWIDPESPYHKPVFAEPKKFVFFCASGWRSALAGKTAVEMGLKDVAHIHGGFGAWKKAGAPVATKDTKPKTP